MQTSKYIAEILKTNIDEISQKWIIGITEEAPQIIDLSGKEIIDNEAKHTVILLANSLEQSDDLDSQEFSEFNTYISELIKEFAIKNINSNEILTFTNTLKYSILPFLKTSDAETYISNMLFLNSIFDKLLLLVFSVYALTNEETIKEQAKAILEMSTPVVKVWNRIILLPLVGILDSSRAKKMMEALLTEIESSQAKIAILDISGIPIIDTLVARHLINTISAVKLMGADCILTGISSKISQTIVHLGLDLSGIVTKSSLADGLQLALSRTGQSIQ
ncbi:MAG: STAS domain-containing protein [Leptospiraceae bacterium]|nr:STAS domain-containing protein [Leptospiraceae bacterium]MCP5501026.1 STAS domain-containing protein [Leptospiraceae bacterium]